MEQEKLQSFQVIGRCVKTQTISLAECFNLIDGVPYDINFFQDFSNARFNGRVLTDYTMHEFLMDFLNPLSVSVPPPSPYPSFKGQEYMRQLCADIEKQEKKERKRAKKWRKKRPKPKNGKEAWRNFKHAVKKFEVW